MQQTEMYCFLVYLSNSKIGLVLQNRLFLVGTSLNYNILS